MEKITILDIIRMKGEERKICMLTAYSYSIAKILDECGIDILLVGDSVGVVEEGYENTLPVTMEEMIIYTRAVSRARKRALVVADMPFMSYQISQEEAKRNAGRFIKEGGAEAVKLEGGINIKDTIEAIVRIDIPVIGHIGLTPQSIHRMGGYKVQGRGEWERMKLIEDASAVEDAGAFALVLEGIPKDLAGEITSKVKIPTIGIGAGVECNGQVLVINDLLGLFNEFKPKFVKRYAHLRPVIAKAVEEFITEVKELKFPSDDYSFH